MLNLRFYLIVLLDQRGVLSLYLDNLENLFFEYGISFLDLRTFTHILFEVKANLISLLCSLWSLKVKLFMVKSLQIVKRCIHLQLIVSINILALGFLQFLCFNLLSFYPSDLGWLETILLIINFWWGTSFIIEFILFSMDHKGVNCLILILDQFIFLFVASWRFSYLAIKSSTSFKSCLVLWSNFQRNIYWIFSPILEVLINRVYYFVIESKPLSLR